MLMCLYIFCAYVSLSLKLFPAYVRSFFTYIRTYNHSGPRNWHISSWWKVWWKLIFQCIRCCKSRFVSIGLKESKYQKGSIVLDNFLMCPQIIVSEHTPVEITKPHKVGLRYAVFRGRTLFWIFEWNERSNNPEKNSKTIYRSEPQYILWVVLDT